MIPADDPMLRWLDAEAKRAIARADRAKRERALVDRILAFFGILGR